MPQQMDLYMLGNEQVLVCSLHRQRDQLHRWPQEQLEEQGNKLDI